MGKIFFWGFLTLLVGGIGYFLGYNHAKLPVIKDFAIIRTDKIESPIPKVTKQKEILTVSPEATESASKSAEVKSSSDEK